MTLAKPLVDVPLVVDVDGTLIKADLLHESFLQLLMHHPLRLPLSVAWLLEGKAKLKSELGKIVDPGTSNIPFREEIVSLIKVAHEEGRKIYLASAADKSLVEKIAARLQGIQGVFGTEEVSNLKGYAKAQRLVQEFGSGNYDYVGNADVDFSVWKHARNVLAVVSSPRFERRVKKRFPNVQIVARAWPEPRHYLRALRPHQWAKNILIFVPVIAGHFFHYQQVALAGLAFICFCTAASAAYILNDLLDLPSDRAHPRKKMRPFASGAVPVSHGMALSIVLLFISAAIGFTLPVNFLIVLCVYFATTLTYSLLLKRKIVVDIVTLGALYTLRVLGGVAVLEVSTSAWLFMFCLFFFLSLASVKRCSELIARGEKGAGSPPGREYRGADVRVLIAFGAAAAYTAVLVIALYLFSPEVAALYKNPIYLLCACPLIIYWITRIFVVAGRGELHEDPVVFALTDRVSWLTAGCVSAIFLAAL